MNINKTTLAILFGVLVLGGIVLLGRSTPASPDVMCTMDVLLCPEGSEVGREGPQCTFRSCPNQDSFVGRLDRQGGIYRLIIMSPKTSGQDSASYAMPLELQTTNVVGQLLGQMVRVRGTFGAGNILRVTGVEELDPEDAGSPDTVTVGIGETKFTNGVKITLHRLVQDSRCPVDAQCIEGGAVTANVTFRSDTDSETFNMASDEVPYKFDSYRISIVNVAPARISAREPEPDSYRVTFKVER